MDSANAAATLSGAHPHISREDGQGHSLSKDSDGAVREAAKLGREALGDVAGVSWLLIVVVFFHDLTLWQDGVVRKDPLTQRQVLVALESLYDLALNIEQLRRDQPTEEEEEEAVIAWCVLAHLTASVLVIGTECATGRQSTKASLRKCGSA